MGGLDADRLFSYRRTGMENRIVYVSKQEADAVKTEIMQKEKVGGRPRCFMVYLEGKAL